MAEEGFEGYHIPQQSRREKLREVGSAQNHPPCVQTQTSDHHHLLLPLYDPTSYISTTELTREFHHNHHHQHRSDSLTSPDESCKTRHHPAGCSNIVKEEGVNLMGFMGGSCLINNSSNTTASSSTSPDQLQHHPYNYLDPRSSANLPLNPTSIHDVNNSPFIFSPQTLQNLDHSTYNGVHDQLVVFRPETLSLSLSSSSHPFDLNLQKYGSAIYSTPPHDDIVLASATNVGPFTAYVSVLKGSRFFKPAQQLLEELCDVGIHGIYSEKIVLDSSLIDPPLETFSSCAGHGIVDDGGENGRKKSRLISMLDEVYTKYKQYCQQIQAIVASFEYVSGLGNAALYAYLAVKTMSKQFRCLKNAITEQLQFPNKASGQQYQRSLHNTGFLEHQPVWRPQRGLPERAVSVLRAWLFEHFLHPYPTDTDKLLLAKQTGLSRNQVSNWFINARVRLWKPMVEEIHMLETRQAEKSTHRPDELLNTDLSNNVNGTPPSAVSLASEYLHSGSKRHILQDTRNQNHHHHHHDMTSNVSSQSDVGVRTTSTASRGAGNGSGVSLTLGLHQNNSAMGLSEPLPIHAAGQSFGLDMNGDHHHHAGGYNIMNGFELQNRHFGRNLGGGQLLHDFVG